MLERQRELLTRLGRRVGVSVVFLKGSWSDAALWENQGTRRGCDVDILVPEARFEAMSRALVREGFTRWFNHGARIRTAAFRAWTFTHPGPWHTVDLHRGLGVDPWFRVDTNALIARAVDWPTPTGAVRGLCADDQVLHLALHHAAEFFSLDERHARDVAKLLNTNVEIDWPTVFDRARKARVDLALSLALEKVRALGAATPGVPWKHEKCFAIRESLIRAAIGGATGRRHASRSERRIEALVGLPLLAGALDTVPRFLARWVLLRAADTMLEALETRAQFF